MIESLKRARKEYKDSEPDSQPQSKRLKLSDGASHISSPSPYEPSVLNRGIEAAKGTWFNNVGRLNSLLSSTVPGYRSSYESHKVKSNHLLMVDKAVQRDKLTNDFKSFAKEGTNSKLIEEEKNNLASQKVTVIGLGPGGLIAAIRAIQEGAQVYAIEKRLEYTRNNIFRLTTDMIQELKTLFGLSRFDFFIPDNHPLKRLLATNTLAYTAPAGFRTAADKVQFGIRVVNLLTGNASSDTSSREFRPFVDEAHYAISTKDLENVLYSYLERLCNEHPDRVTIYRGYEYQPNVITSDSNSILIRKIQSDKEIVGPSEVEIATDLLVGADGYNSRVRQDCAIEVEKISTPADYATYTYFYPSNRNYNGIEEQETGLIPLSAGLWLTYGWNFLKLPVARFFSTSEHVYLGIEIPQTLTNELEQFDKDIKEAEKNRRFDQAYRLKQEKQEVMDSWSKFNLQRFLPNSLIRDLTPKSFNWFRVQLQRAKSSIKSFSSGLHVLLLGDAKQSAHFQTGQGAIAAMRQGFLIGELIKSLNRGEPLNKALKRYESSADQINYDLHSIAFNFPTGENLQVQPTQEFNNYRFQHYYNRVKNVAEPVIEIPQTIKSYMLSKPK